MTDRPLSDPDSPEGSLPFRPVCTAQISTALHHRYAAASAPLYYGCGLIARRDFWRLGFLSGVLFLAALFGLAVAAGDGTVRHPVGTVYHPRAMPKPATSAPTYYVVREFGGRHRAVKRALLVALDRVGCRSISVTAASMHMASPWAPMTATAVALLLTVPYARAGSRYRCPACGAKPSTGDGDPGMLLNPPPQCGGCGVRLT